MVILLNAYQLNPVLIFQSTYVSPIIFKNLAYLSSFAYKWGMTSLHHYLDELLSRGQSCFSREEALDALGLSSVAFIAAAGRLARKHRLVSPRRGFYLILRPEDRVSGAPDPVRWIDPLMKYLGLDYRISLLRAAAFHGASHQAVMVFQVIVPKQLRAFDIGRHRLQFIYQAPAAFAKTNLPDWLSQMKSEAGFAKVAGVELTLLDCARYFHKAAGINGVAQIVKDIGARADSRKLVKAAMVYENSVVRRLGYLLDHAGYVRQAKALEPFAMKAKSMKPLDPSIKPLTESLAQLHEINARWKLAINEPVEIDF
ncbi:MAG: hypothetical protein GY875_10630 [Gammaproteobacteria bacterium]|nr:hypothetical protein [Gammaproteobacteria bacterium]